MIWFGWCALAVIVVQYDDATIPATGEARDSHAVLALYPDLQNLVTSEYAWASELARFDIYLRVND